MTRVFKLNEELVNEVNQSLKEPYNNLEDIKTNMKHYYILRDLGLDNGLISQTEKNITNINENITNMNSRLNNRVEEVRTIDSMMASKLAIFRESMEKK